LKQWFVCCQTFKTEGGVNFSDEGGKTLKYKTGRNTILSYEESVLRIWINIDTKI